MVHWPFHCCLQPHVEIPDEQENDGVIFLRTPGLIQPIQTWLPFNIRRSLLFLDSVSLGQMVIRHSTLFAF